MQRIKKIGNNQITIIVCIIVVFLAQLSERIDNDYLMYIGYSLVTIWSFKCDSKSILGMAIFLLSDNSILDIGGISIQLVLILVYCIKFAISGKRGFHKYTLIMGIVIAVYSFIYKDLGMSYMLQGAKLGLMIVVLTEIFIDKEIMSLEGYEAIINYAVIGLVSSVVLAIVVNPSILLAGRVALSEESNWNLLGILAAILFSHCFSSYFVINKRKYILYALAMIVCAIISTSRTALVIIGVSVIWGILFLNSKNKKGKTLSKKIFIISIIIAFIALLINGMIESDFINKLIDRIVNPRRGDISNGRFTLWERYINYLLNNRDVLIWGHGSPLIEGITTLTSNISVVAHNMYIEQLVMYGIVGNIIVTALYMLSYRRIKMEMQKEYLLKKHRTRYIINIVIIFICGMFSHLLTSVLVTMELYLGIMQYLIFSSEKKDSDGEEES